MHSTQTITRVVAVALLIITGLFCLIAAEADAAPFTPELEADYASALAWYKVDSPPRCATVTRELLPQDVGEADGVEAMARGTQPRLGEVGVACSLRAYENYVMPGCYEEAAIRHEVGHLLGLGHSTDPTSVMYPQIQTAWCPSPESEPLTAAAPAIPPLPPRPVKARRCKPSRIACARRVA